MIKYKILVGILLAVTLNIPVSFAQEYVIPEPVCVDTPEIPCPGKGRSYENAQKPVANIKYDVPTGFSKIFDSLSSIATKIGDTADYTMETLRNWFGGFYDGLLKRFRNNK